MPHSTFVLVPSRRFLRAPPKVPYAHPSALLLPPPPPPPPPHQVVKKGEAKFLEHLTQPIGGAVGRPGDATYRTKMRGLKYKKQFRFSPDAGATTFLVDRYIADGTFGQCYFAKNEATDEVAVLKLFKKRQAETHTAASGWTSEVANLINLPPASLDHKNIMGVQYVCPSSLTHMDHGFLMVDACTNGELLGFISPESGPFSEKMVRYFVRDLLLAVQHMHSHGVAHRDLKCENILLDGAGRLQVCDFGMTKFFQGGYAPAPVAPVAPMAPTMPMGPPAMPGAPPMPGAPGAGGAAQYLMKTTTVAVSTEALQTPQLVAAKRSRGRHGYNADKLDLFSCGVVAFVLQVGAYPFGTPRREGGEGVNHDILKRAETARDATNREFWEKWRRTLGGYNAWSAVYPARLSPESEAFLNRIFKFDANLCPTVDELLLDPWLAAGPGRYPTGDEMTADLMRRKAGTKVEVNPADWAADGTPAADASAAASAETASDASASAAASTAADAATATATAAPMMAKMRSFYAGEETGVADSAFRQIYTYDFVGAALAAEGVDPVGVLVAALKSAVAAGPVGGVQLIVAADEDALTDAGADTDGAICEVVSRNESGTIDVHLIVVAKSEGGVGHVLEVERHIGKAMAVTDMLIAIRSRVAAIVGDTRGGEGAASK